jgi:hypothetical protein
MSTTESTDIKEVVKQKYGEAAREVGRQFLLWRRFGYELLRSHDDQPLRHFAGRADS